MPDASAARTTIHLVPHTHWDREWYRPFQSFRIQLVDLVDRVLDMLESDSDFRFTLDGQLATIDDYLEVRPEAAERIARHVRSGRLAIGPWLILMDEFLVSGETLVRNLASGWRRAADFGEPMPVGYLPDMFGHVAQMPQILRRAGLDDAVVWRGVPAAVDRHRFRWEAPDGSFVRAEYLPAGYGNAASLFAAPEQLDAAAARFVDWSSPWFGGDPVLAMYGTDHTAPVPELAALVSRLNEIQATSTIRVDTLAAYLATAPPLTEADPCWRGEMRSGARANVLMGVTSARIDIKQAAGRSERVLERFAEPLSALHVASESWPEAMLALAWRRVIENSAHDSICGCSIDPVVDQVLVRFAEAEQVGTALTRRAAATVATAVPRGSLALLNPSPTPRSGVVRAELAVPESWGAVALECADGTRVATQELGRKEPVLLDTTIRGDEVDQLFRRFHGREIFDHAWNGYRIRGRTLVLEVDTDPDPVWLDVDELRSEIVSALRSAPDEAWTVRIVARARRTLAAAVPVPALGWTAARAVEGDAEPAHAVEVSEDGRRMGNGRVTVEVRADGCLDLVAEGGARASGVGRLVDGGDVGDSYNYAPPATDRLVDTPDAVAIERELDGPVVGRVVIRRTFRWPVAAAADGSARSEAVEPTEVEMDVELHAGEPFVRIGIAFENRSDDHRLRLHLPLPRHADVSHAEGQFAVVERGTTPEGGYREEPLATYPAHGWVDAGGLAVLLQHVSEYELLAGRRELAITVLRSIGLISRNDNRFRLDPAGPEIPIPNAQMRGRRRFAFAILPHAGTWSGGEVVVAAEAYRHDVLAWPGGGRDAPWPPSRAGHEVLRLTGDDVVLSSLRRAADGWLEARIVNLSGTPRSATLAGDLLEARGADLLGHPGAVLDLDPGGALVLRLAAAEIRTLHLRRRETASGSADVLDAAGPRLSA